MRHFRIRPVSLLAGIGMVLLAACGGDNEAPVQVETEVPTAVPTESPISIELRPTEDTSSLVTVGETVQGVVQADHDPNTWFLNAAVGENIQIQVTRFTDTLLPSVRVFAPDSAGLGEFSARGQDFVVTSPIEIASADAYRIEVTGNGTEGQYAMKVSLIEGANTELAQAPTETEAITLMPTITPTTLTPTPSITFSPTPNAQEVVAVVTISNETETPTPTSENSESSGGGIEVIDSVSTPRETATSEVVVDGVATFASSDTTDSGSEVALQPTSETVVTDAVEGESTPREPSESAAQSNSGRLALNETLQGTITISGETQRYTFFGNATEPMSLVMNRDPQNPGDLNPFIQVQAPNGEIVAENDDMIDGIVDAAVRVEEMPATGVYIVYVKSADEVGTGGFLLTLGDQPYTLRDVERGTAAEGVANVDRLETYGARDVWTVDLKAGDVVSISVEIVDPLGEPDFDVMTELISPEGEALDFDDDGGEGNNAFMSDIPAPVDGIYHIHVAAQNNASVGEYRLVWLKVNVASPTPRPTNTPFPTTPTITPIPSPIPPVDTIEGVVEANSSFFYTIQADALQDVNIVVQGQNGFDPVLRVYDATGTLVLEVDDVGQSTDPRARFVAEPSGLFLIEIVGFEGTGGSFTLNYIVQ